jgi:hypothetical protein
MNRFLMIPIICLLAGCSLLKGNVKSERQHSLQSELTTSSFQKDSIAIAHVSVIRDSLHEEYIVEIIPQGEFSYSSNDGFKGMGKLIRMTGKRNGKTDLLEKSNHIDISSSSQQSATRQKEIETVHQSKKVKFGNNFSIWIIVAIIIGLLWVWWKLRKGRN